MKFRKPYDGPRRHTLTCKGPSLTRQSFAQECDINYILRKYQKTGLVEHVNKFQGNYADLTDIPTYQDALNKVIEANDAFSSLPSSIRKRFGNDPEEFLAFVSDPTNADEMVQLGLAHKLPIPPSTTEPLSPEDAPPSA